MSILYRSERVLPALAFAACVAAPGAFAQSEGDADLSFEPIDVVSPSQGSGVDPDAGFLVSGDRFHSDPVILWDGFLSGLRGFESFYLPVGNPLYFESPINDTRISFLYLHHEFSEGSQLQGGDLDVVALQARIAITERFGIIATKDGYSDFTSGAVPGGDGWNDIAIGFKYTFYANEETDTVAALGLRYQFENGKPEVLQGNVQELSPYLSFGQGFGDFHVLANLTYRAPLDDDDGNHVLQWSAHFDYEIVDGVAPMVEFHGLHYLSDGNRVPFSVGGLDYANLGSADVEGSSVVWMGVGLGLKFTPNFEVGATYEFALTDPDDDIMDERVTILAHLKW